MRRTTAPALLALPLLAGCVQPGMHAPGHAQIGRAMTAHIQPCQPDSDGISTCDVRPTGFHVAAARCGPAGTDIHGAAILFCRVTYRAVFLGRRRVREASTGCFPFRRQGRAWRVAEVDGEQDRCTR